MRRLKARISNFCLLFVIYPAWCQSNPVKIGERIPDVRIDNIVNYRISSGSTNDFRGKCLLLDFWSTSCAPCIKAFPILKELEDRYSNSLDVLPVSFEDRSSVLRMLDRIEESHALKMPSVTGDRILNSLFPHDATPYYVLIDGQGEVKYFGNRFDENILISFLSSDAVVKAKMISFKNLGDPGKISELVGDTSGSLYAMIAKLGMQEFASQVSTDSSIISCHLLTKYVPLFSGAFGNITPNSYYVSNGSIMFLFQLAYARGDLFRFTPGWNRIQLITKDTLSLNADMEHSTGSQYTKWRTEPGHNWNYFVKVDVKDSSNNDKFEVMKADLHRAFPYISANIEERTISVLALRRYGKGQEFISQSGKMSMDVFLNLVKWRLQDETIVDETGYLGNVAINISNNDFSNIEILNNSLRKSGLELIRENRKRPILVIRDLRGGL